jgi:hypothetical protein
VLSGFRQKKFTLNGGKRRRFLLKAYKTPVSTAARVEILIIQGFTKK